MAGFARIQPRGHPRLNSGEFSYAPLTRKRTGGTGPLVLLRCLNECRREDLNLHGVNPHQVLNLARLPIPPLRLTPVFRGRDSFLQAPAPRFPVSRQVCP